MKEFGLTEQEREAFRTARSARLATADPAGRPNVVPICFSLVGDSIVTPIDEKPKKRADDLRRVRDIRTNPFVAVLIDQYSEAWSDLWWIQIRGRAELLEATADAHTEAVTALQQKYSQYADHRLSNRPVICIEASHAVSWQPGDSR